VVLVQSFRHVHLMSPPRSTNRTMPSRQGIPRPHVLQDNIRQAIESESLQSTSKILNDPSHSRKRDDLLAYALAVSCEMGNHGAVRYLLVRENADANRSSRWHNDKDEIPPLVLAVICLSSSLSSLKSARSDGNLLSDKEEDVKERTEIIKSLFEHQALLHISASDKKTALSHVAHLEIAEVVLASSTKPDFKRALDSEDNEKRTPLMYVLETHDHSSVANFYIDNGADTHAVDGGGRSVLTYAIWKNHTDLVERLVQDKDLVRKKDHQKRNIWHHVAMDQQQLRVKAMLDSMASVDENDAGVDDVDDKKRTSLHSSATYGTVAVANAILQRSTLSLNAGGHRDKTPLHFAAAYGHTDLVKLLLEHKAKVDPQCNGNFTPLHLACGCGTDADEIVNHLLERGAAIESQTEEKMTPLHIAAAHGQLAVVRALLAAPWKADINAKCEGGWTPLHLASWGRHIHYLDPSADTVEDPRREPPKANYVEVVHELLKAGANINGKSGALKTALHLAAESGQEDVVRLLLEQKNIKLALKDDQGNTPLLNAAKSDQGRNIVPLLAPWTQQSIDSLPSMTKRVAQEFDANIFDFQKDGSRPHRYQASIYNLLYADYIKAGVVTTDNVSTRPEHADDGSFRWIHLPANNLSWAHTLLTKHFIESECSDVEEFKEFERSLSQLQYRGQKPHARHFRSTCSRLSRRPWNQDHSHPRISESPLSDDLKLKSPLRVDSIGLESDEPSRPPRPPMFRRSTDLDQDLFRSEPMTAIKFGKQTRNRERHFRASQSKTSAGLRSLGNERSISSSMHTEPASSHDSSSTSKAKICLFMPYLDLEKKRAVDDMHKHIYSNDSSSTSAGIGLHQSQTIHRDKQLYSADLASDSNEYRLHIRRTLDQFRYKNVNTRARDDDQVVWRYQDSQQNDSRNQGQHSGRDEHDILMVDQLWIWVFGPQLIVTCFPQGWRHTTKKTPALLSNILEGLNPRSGRPVLNIHELAVRIVGHCLAACDRSAERHEKLNYLDMFSSSIGTAMDKEVNTFKRFKSESDRAAKWLTRPTPEHIPENGVKPRSKQGQGSQDVATEDPDENEHFLNIRDETLLLLEVKDIRDELGILSQVLDDQSSVLSAMYKTFKPVLANESTADQQRVLSSGDDNLLTLQHQKTEIDSMISQVQAIYKSIVNSLEHKQRHASAIQARYAAIEARYTRELANSTAEQAASTAKAGRILMIFTIVTVIFLPLSFLAAFFAINLDELPHNDQSEQQLSLSFVMKYVVGVGLGTAFAFVFVAWYWHGFVRWMRENVIPLFSLTRIRAKLSVKGRNMTDQNSKLSSAVSLPSGSGFRIRARGKQTDPEKAQSGSSPAWSTPG
jgi:ankyrin repeat protein/Mg2+ and Co2+ transporter CorA